MSTIQVLGTGCTKCGHVLKHAQHAVSELNRNDTVVKIDDIVQILDFAPSALPALVIDGQVVFAGTIPSVEQIKQTLTVETNSGDHHES